jgi:aminoglycoside 3-N-acetyltransferase
MISYRDLIIAFQRLGIDKSQPVLVHSSISSLGEIRGEEVAVVGALVATFHTVIMPTFTYRTMVIPETGPPDNAIKYGSGRESNLRAEIFNSDMAVDQSQDQVPEVFRHYPGVKRTMHPILSFAGINAHKLLSEQTLNDPLAFIKCMEKANGWVLLLGADQTTNISIHYAERLAGRMQFIRWALTPGGIRECPHIPGCSQGFNSLTAQMRGVIRRIHLGNGWLQAIPLPFLINFVQDKIINDPTTFLCHKPTCNSCQTVRKSVTIG